MSTLKNAVAAVFYIENSTPEEIEKNYKELIELLKYIFKFEGGQIVNSIVRWMQSVQKITLKTKQIKTIENITEVSTMWEAAVRRHEEALLNKGVEKGIEKGKILEKQDILIDHCAIKFGKSVTTEKKIRSGSDGAKLEAALRKILFSSSKSEVLKCLE